ncbi:MAG TPA: hypothetical protein VF134_01900 [Candidatus Dormibacteraeota bacterium]
MADETQLNDVATYAAAVRAQLSDLPPGQADVLLEDLEDHLAEVAAESGAPLAARLGSPAAYAAELRAAYGLAQEGGRRWRFARLARLGRWIAGFESYRAVRGYLPELRPAWWVLRAYLLVLALAVLLRGGRAIHPVPNPLSSLGLLEIVAMGVAVVVSVRIGRWSRRGDRGGPWPIAVGNVVVAFAGLVALGGMSTPDWNYGSPVSEPCCVRSDVYAANRPLTNIYPYTADGKPLDGVLLYAQYGQPLMVGGKGSGVTTQYPMGADGLPITNEYPQRQTRLDGSVVPRPRVALPVVAASPTPSPTPTP